MLIHGGDMEGFREERGKIPLDFSANISPLGLPEGVKSAVLRALETADQYPDPLCRRLTATLAQAEAVPAENILCGNGAADLIFRLVLAVAPKRALVLAPTFAEYEQALHLVGCRTERYPLRREDDFRVTEALLDRITPELDLLFLCQPNNPTGQPCEPSLLHQILAACEKNHLLLVADECFVDFLDAPGDYTLHGSLHSPQLFILKAFTKLYAMAGIRLGYGLCGDTALLDKMRGCGQPWSVSSLAQAAGVAALGETAYVAELRALIAVERPWMLEQMGQMGCRCMGSQANFIFFESIPGLDGLLREQDILIRSCANYAGLGEGFYRVAVRTHRENLRLLAAMAAVLGVGR